MESIDVKPNLPVSEINCPVSSLFGGLAKSRLRTDKLA